MELFDYLNVLMTDKEAYNKLTNYEKQKHFFMTNRRMSIQYPIQAHALQIQKINMSAAADVWHNIVYSKTKPKWIYTAGVKSNKNKPTKKHDISSDDIKKYCDYMKISTRTFNEALDMFKDKFVKEVKTICKLINEQK